MSESPTRTKNRRALKAVTASVLGIGLLAGAGTTFAKWYEEQSIGESSLTAGHLNISVENAEWKDVNKNTTINAETFKMVPGDKLSYTANVTPDLVGDNLEATLKVNTAGTVTGDLAKIVKIKTTVNNGDTTEMTVTPANTTAIPVTVEIEFPLTTDGAKPLDDKSNWWKDQGEDKTVDLTAIKIELNQNDNPK